MSSVQYTEQYEHIPLVTNTALANYSVYQDQVSSTQQYSALLKSTQQCSAVLSSTQQYSVQLSTTQASQDLRISSVHETCLLPGELWCLTSTGENSFRFHDTGTEVAEVEAFR